jgi:muramoyltetrapeptide carboxypeptidase
MPAPTRIAVVCPASRIEESTAERVGAFVKQHYAGRAEIAFHPQCFLTSNHFAGDDAARTDAFVAVANDPQFDAVWAGRGGYGSNRIALRVLGALSNVARSKTYLGYSDVGFLLAGLYRAGFANAVHGPVVNDILREGGDAAVKRALDFLVARDPATLEPAACEGKCVAFNAKVLNDLLGTALEPDLSGHVLMLEEVSEYMYALDRCLFHLTATPSLRRVAGIRLGRVSAVPDNDPPFGEDEEQVVKHWCALSGVPYLGRADIGHDVDNKIVPFGGFQALTA